jgi:ribA/ribD-fused uncharacterized protein
MNHHYDIDWLNKKFDNGEQLNFLFFWGHTNKIGKEAGMSCFSQWFDAPFTVDGVVYKTSEHWMMAQKALLFGDTKSFHSIIKTETPKEAKDFGRNVHNFDEEIWNTNRFEIVKNGNIHKFNQHPDFAKYLHSTGDKILVEASPVDTIWGIGLSHDSQNIDNPYYWRGLNLLGFALMEVRDFLNDFDHFKEMQIPVELPWNLHPTIHPNDMFWQMGKGEEAIVEFSKFYSTLPNKEKQILKLTRPAPYEWKGFYDD